MPTIVHGGADLTGVGTVQQNGTVADAGFIRVGSDARHKARNAGNTGNIELPYANGSDIIVTGEDTYTAGFESRAKTGGLWKWLVNNVEKVRLGASGVLTDVIDELTSATGVTIDGLLVKDGHLPNKYRQHVAKWTNDTAVAAGTDITRYAFHTFEYACTIQSVKACFNANITTSGSDAITVTVYLYNNATLVGTVAAHATSASGFVADVVLDFGALTQSAAAAGYSLHIETTHSGTGRELWPGVVIVNALID